MRRFTFRLALALGKTVRELLAEITSYELSEWLAYFNLENLGDSPAYRLDLSQSIQTAALVNSLNAKANAKPSQFIPRFLNEQSAAQKSDNLRAYMIARAKRAKDARENPPDEHTIKTVRAARPAKRQVHKKAARLASDPQADRG